MPSPEETSFEIAMAKADRLHVLTQSVGYAVWQLQALEGSLATFFVLSAQATRGMGAEAGQILIDRAQAKTFGTTIKELERAQKLPQRLVARLRVLLSERNWLVHESRAGCRRGVYDPIACSAALERIEAIADEAAAVLKELDPLSLDFVQRSGVSTEYIERLASETLRAWQSGPD